MTPGVLFDVDGTLIDSNYLHALAWSRAFRDVGEWAPMNAIHRLVGMGGDHLVPRVLGHECPEADEARAKRYRELIDEVEVFPGAPELLWRVHELGLQVVLATSSPKDELEIVLEKLGCDEVIATCTTADDIEATKPAPDVFDVALERSGVDRESALVVGDSVWDIRAARAAGLGCIGVETGGFSAHELREEGALFVYRDVDELRCQVLTSPIHSLL